MAVYELKNETIAIQVDSCGAELRSLKKLDTGIEYLWQADPTFWGRTSPILFPFVGGLHNKTYRTKGKTYTMMQHGFARDLEFEMISCQPESEIWFERKSDAETLEKYPYEFILKLGYKLLPNGVSVLWQVENPASEALPFSIGGHPAFNCPLDADKKQTDYQIFLDAKDEVLSSKINKIGLATGEKERFSLQNGLLPITENLFDEDALVIEHDQAKTVALCNEKGEPYLTVTMDAPLFGIWSPPHKNAPFICIEPWYGRCDQENFEGDLTEREWGNLLAPGDVWKREYQIKV